MARRSNRNISFWIALIYVGLGTILIFEPFWGLLFNRPLFYLFAPVSFFAWVIRFTESDSTLLILGVQTAVFFLTWLLSHSLITIVRRDPIDESKHK